MKHGLLSEGFYGKPFKHDLLYEGFYGGLKGGNLGHVLLRLTNENNVGILLRDAVYTTDRTK